MKTHIRISVKDFCRNKSLKIQPALVRSPVAQAVTVCLSMQNAKAWIDSLRRFVNNASMRLEPGQVQAIREEIGRFDADAAIYLYGSRADDSAKGGDIDLLVVSDRLGFRELLHLRTAILDRIGWQQLDMVVRRHDQLNEPLAMVARETGIKL